ncbi:unnamed protein product, partial [Effrenium voratum]
AREVQCEHARALRALVRQAAQLARRFQETHGRRHGDLKADNVLVDRRGRLRVSDFLSPFCVACDREEFCSSIRSGHPLSQELQKAFEEEWHNSVSQESPRRVAWLAEEMSRLSEASSQSLFGPMPDLLQSVPGFRPPTCPGPDLSPSDVGDARDALSASAGAVAAGTPQSSPSGHFSFFKSSRSSLGAPKATPAWGRAGTAPALPGSQSFQLTEPNLLTQARNILAASPKDSQSPSLASWQTPSWEGSSPATPGVLPGRSELKPGGFDFSAHWANKGPTFAGNSAAFSPFFPSSDRLAERAERLAERLAPVPSL